MIIILESITLCNPSLSSPDSIATLFAIALYETVGSPLIKNAFEEILIDEISSNYLINLRSSVYNEKFLISFSLTLSIVMIKGEPSQV